MSFDKEIIHPEILKKFGTIHPISSTLIHISSILESYGFSPIFGPELETEEFNFDMLNKTFPITSSKS